MFNKISQAAFEELQVDAGVLLTTFDPDNPVEPQDDEIITATTGGIQISLVPTFEDFGEDVDNCPNNTMELKRKTGEEAKISTTALGTSPALLRLAIGTADVSGSKVTPRINLKQTDFSEVWWVGEKANGGLVACVLRNGLSTGGLSLQTTKNGKGQIGLELTGHVSLSDPTKSSMEFWSEDPENPFYRIENRLSHVINDNDALGIESGEDYEATLTAADGYTIENVVITVDGEDVTDSVYTSATGAIEITAVDGPVLIIATAIVA